MDDSYSDLSKKFDIFSLISEKISQLTNLKTTLNDILAILKKVTGCRHLALRLIDSKGNIPFYAYLGLEKEFLDSEHWITIKDCLCGYVASGDIDRRLPFISEYGSFFTNSMAELMAEIKIKHHQIAGRALRDSCNRNGYESVAIIPIKLKDKIIAELYL